MGAKNLNGKEFTITFPFTSAPFTRNKLTTVSFQRHVILECQKLKR